VNHGALFKVNCFAQNPPAGMRGGFLRRGSMDAAGATPRMSLRSSGLRLLHIARQYLSPLLKTKSNIG
jgi:hypothetical protein